jgi:hypothetical protein
MQRAWQRLAAVPAPRADPVIAERRVLLGGGRADVRLRHDPEHVVIVKRQVPLDVAWAVLLDVVRVRVQRGAALRIEVPVPDDTGLLRNK